MKRLPNIAVVACMALCASKPVFTCEGTGLANSESQVSRKLRTEETESAVMMRNDATSEQLMFRQGLLLHPHPKQTESAIDVERVLTQQCHGCSGSQIRYASSATMRGTVEVPEWSIEVRKLISAASLTDEYTAAMSDIADAKTMVNDEIQRQILENREIEFSLQFGDHASAFQLLQRSPTEAATVGPLLSDRLFWKAYLQAENATAKTWQTQINPLLEQAFSADSTSYQVRVWRLFGWFGAKQWAQERGCTAAIRKFSNLLLDTTEQSACPLMLGHLSHALERRVQKTHQSSFQKVDSVWFSFAQSLLAMFAGNTALGQEIRNDIDKGVSNRHCRAELLSAIDAVGHSAL